MQERVPTPLALAMAAVEAEMAVEMAAAGEVAHHPRRRQDGATATPLLVTRMSEMVAAEMAAVAEMAAAAAEMAAAAAEMATEATAVATRQEYIVDSLISQCKASGTISLKDTILRS